MNTQRERSIQVWLTAVLPSDQFEIKYLAGDASFRRYARVIQNKKTFMLMDAPPIQEDCRPFVQIDEFFDGSGVRVPHIVAKDLEQGFLLLEDFGDVVLAQLLSKETVNAYYTQCFKQLLHLQTIDGSNVLPYYDYQKLMSEMHLLTQWFFPALDIQLTKTETQLIHQTFNVLADRALSQPQVIVHRDFHSRNLMKIENKEVLGVIDFQDAVIGADTYDLISLTRDAYVQWSAQQVDEWFEQFYLQLPETSKINRPFKRFKKDADFMAMQRHIKILGIFVRLSERDGKTGYLKDLPLVMWYVLNQANQYSEMAEFLQFMQQRVVPKFNEKYGIYKDVHA